MQKTTHALAASKSKAKRDVSGGDMLEPMTSADYNADKFLNDQRKVLNVFGITENPTPKGTLIEPPKFIKCVSEECNYLISIKEDVCPFCGTKQPELAKDTGIGDDTDQDGIPDLYEQKSQFLNYRNPNDARGDYDGDGFLNIEEFQAKTKPDDKDDFPALGNLLRVGKVFRQNIPFKLIDIDKNRSEEVKKWDVIVMYFDKKKRGMKRAMCQVGDTIGGFKILQAAFTGSDRTATPYAIVAPEGKEAVTYRLEPNKETPDKNLSVHMVYLASRLRQYAPTIVRRYIIVKKVGEEFQLVKDKSSSRQVEYYRLLEANEKDSSVKVALLSGAKGDVKETFQLAMFNFRQDFIDESRRMGGMYDGMDGGMDGGMGMEGGPMMDGGAGARQRPRGRAQLMR